MPWIVGIDEAGYGPNLGPFVMSAVACRVPEEHASRDLWKVLQKAVRRASDKQDADRTAIDDSKLVYSTAEGLAALETGVLATVGRPHLNGDTSLGQLVQAFAESCGAELGREAWYTGDSPLPHAADRESVANAGQRFDQACRQAAVTWQPARSAIVCSGRFNQLVDRWGTKGTVLGHCLAELLQTAPPGDEPTYYYIDKHGGRNFYAAMLQQALPEGMVVAREEGSLRSVYEVLGLGRQVRLTFEPRADSAHFCVALASMTSKYLRELLMHEFNQFWLAKVPSLKPTAGYPGDAARFYKAIRPVADGLGLAEAALWRRK